MKIEFKQVKHGIRDATLVEVWIDGKLKACIYPNGNGDGIRVISRHVQGDPLASYTEVEDMETWEFRLV